MSELRELRLARRTIFSRLRYGALRLADLGDLDRIAVDDLLDLGLAELDGSFVRLPERRAS